jgi:hypothetical protein
MLGRRWDWGVDCALTLYSQDRHKDPKTRQERDYAPPEYGSFLLDSHVSFLLQGLQKYAFCNDRTKPFRVAFSFKLNHLVPAVEMILVRNKKNL